MNRIGKSNGRLQTKVESLLARRQLKTFMKKTAFGMSCIAVFCVVYALVAPALTVEWPPKCGLTEHTHTDECYGTVIPVEMNCTLDASDADIIIHEHDEFCYDENGNLICELPEVKAHTHDETCYMLVPTVDLEEGSGRDDDVVTESGADISTDITDEKTDEITETVTDEITNGIMDGVQEVVTEKTDTDTNTDADMNTDVNGGQSATEANDAVSAPQNSQDVHDSHEAPAGTDGAGNQNSPAVSGESEHVGLMNGQLLIASLDGTIPTSETPVCGMEEVIPHTHTASCYDANGNLICGMPQVIVHQHTEACRKVGEPQRGLICGKVEHTHTDLCWLDKQPEYYCGLEEHNHSDECYDENGELICGKVQHAHTEICMLEPEAMAIDETYTYETETVTTELHIAGDAMVPGAAHIAEDAALEFTAVPSVDDEEYEAYVEELAEEGIVVDAQIFEYELTYGGYPLDLSECEVTADIKPTESLIEFSQSPDAIGAMSAMAIDLEDETEIAQDEESQADLGLMILAGDAESEPQEGIISEESAVTLKLKSNRVRVGIIETANPTFTVQYYAPMQRIKSGKGNLSGYSSLEIIDTDRGTLSGGGDGSGGNMPKNGTANPSVKNIYLDSKGNVLTEEVMTEIYSAKEFTYLRAPNLKYFNIVTKDTLDGAYELTDVWVLKEGRDPKSTDENDWDKYKYDTDLKFTNRIESKINDRYIFIDENSVLRLIYDAKISTYSNPVNFYDYDISYGRLYQNATAAKNLNTSGYMLPCQLSDAIKAYGTVYMKTERQGINSDGNYEGTGTKLAFGNANTGTGLGNNLWRNNGKNNALNTSNTTGHSGAGNYKGLTFDIASGLDANGHIQYGTGIIAPKLFNDGTATGKTAYDDKEYALKFNRVGDTYTLSAVLGNGGTELAKARNLETFGHPGSYSIWTNHFWPMDSAPSWGGNLTDWNHDPKFGGTATKGKIKSATNSGDFPASDDGKDHNSYFGMQFAVSFELTKEYIGPLEYYFFGDDDMWVFLNGKRVIDIGGVHSSVGEYVNLWDYIDKNELAALGEDETKTYTLTFFYTERGASGSTCWMNFTLPTVVGLDLEKQLEEMNDTENGALWIEKTVDGIVDPTAEFEFTIELFTKDADGNITYLPDNYGGETLTRDESGAIIKGDKENVIHSGDKIKLKDGGAMVLYNIPAVIVEGEGENRTKKPVYYRITEAQSAGYHTTYTVTEEVLKKGNPELPGIQPDGDTTAQDMTGVEISGRIDANVLDKVIYTNHAAYELPNTGAGGTWMYTIGGLLAIGIAASFMYRKKLLQKERA